MHYQIIIVGAGPAGCSAAIHAAESGLSVLILEGLPFPRTRPGETLHPGIEPLFQKLGIIHEISSGNYYRPSGIFYQTRQEQEFKPYRAFPKEDPWLGWIIPRDEMDNCLLKRAVQAGARLIVCKGQLSAFLGTRSRVLVGSQQFTCDYVFDASGHNFWLSRQLALPVHQKSRKLIAYYGTCEGEFEPAARGPLFCLDKESWTWIARLKPSIYQWTFLDYLGIGKDKHWRPTALKDLRPKGLTKSRDVTWRISSQPSGKNYYCLGDAAFVTDPSSSQGVLKAVMSGLMAGHLVEHVLNRKTISPDLASDYYSQWINRWFKNEIKLLHKT
jgi:flavin-dependent dehydrogenase